MAKVSVLNVAVLENPSPFHSPLRFEISFECSEALSDDLEWKIIYVGSAESEEFDQILDSVLVGPVPAGIHMFIFQEFIRVGYYVNNEYPNPELRKNPPLKPDFSQLQRNILTSNPRVTHFHINWDNNMDRLEAIESQDPVLGCGLPIS
ncbi:histone chaperone ASF1B isoform X2 [Manis javanica]|uniref:histone chaperone ASF1B isoform X2 n=1 Tax=Manis javanica TaxID=9974 RepID=UPI000813AA98|nr:histone chaperone ASF1B isoform X2 [Manis javanica]